MDPHHSYSHKYKHTKTYRQILERDEMSLWLVPKKKRKEMWCLYGQRISCFCFFKKSIKTLKIERCNLNRGSLHIIIPPPLLSILLPDNKQREREGEWDSTVTCLFIYLFIHSLSNAHSSIAPSLSHYSLMESKRPSLLYFPMKLYM